MDSIENLLRQAVDTFRPGKALRDRLKAKIRPAPTVTVAFISENSQKILDAVFHRNQKLFKKSAQKITISRQKIFSAVGILY